MGKPTITNIFKSIQTSVVKHSPEILTGIGIAGMLTTTVLAVKATPKAIKLIEAKKEEVDRDKLAPIDTVKTVWKCYIPSAITATTSIACLIGASSVNARRNAVLATVYKISETTLNDYKAKVVETIGEKKEKAIRDKVVEERVKNDPVSKKEIFITEKGNTLCYDTLSGRYFRSDIELIRRAENELNKELIDEMYVSLNDFYDKLGLNHTNLGYQLGWKIDDGLIELDFSSHLSDKNEPCLAIDYNIAPKYDYAKLI